MTADAIAFHAAERPDAVAMINDNRIITYRQFRHDLRAVTTALRAFGLPRGAKAAVGCEDFYHHWLLLMGLERLGIASTSLVGYENELTAPLLLSMDLVLSEQKFPAEIARRHHWITPAWLEQALACEPGDGVPPEPDDPVRIIRTSGTTGVPKQVCFTRHKLDLYLEALVSFLRLTHGMRFLLTLPFAVEGCYVGASAYLRAGGTVVLDSRRARADALSAHRINHVILLPVELSKLLAELPPGYAKAPDLTIISFGASLPASLRQEALGRVARDIQNIYGTSEVGLVAAAGTAETDAALSILPGVGIEIVDDRDLPLPYGQQGQIRVKTDFMISGYLDDPQATSAMFRDGWFYPGDIGVLRSPDRVEILGRSDDLLNLGGIKVAPASIEDALVKSGLARDLALFTVPNASGVDELFVAVCAGRDATADREIERILGHLGAGPPRVVKVDSIPRTAMGKIQRNLLKEAVAREKRRQ